MRFGANISDVIRIVEGEHKDPFSTLGIHKAEDLTGNLLGMAVRAFIPDSEAIEVIPSDGGAPYAMKMVHSAGFYEAAITDRGDFFPYKLQVTDRSGSIHTIDDPYCFWPVLTEFDLHLFNEGNHHRIFDKFGAHIMEINGTKGTLFAVWAPCARRVSVVGDFNNWDG